MSIEIPSAQHPTFSGITILKQWIDAKLGKNAWFDFEVETILSELDLPLWSQSLEDKVYLLKTIGIRPEIFYEDFWFTLVATDVINGNPADFSSIPHVTSLELAYAILEMQTTLMTMDITPRYTDGFIEAVAKILRSEGYSTAPVPFGFVPEDMLEKGQTAEDSADKAKAIGLYIRHMVHD